MMCVNAAPSHSRSRKQQAHLKDTAQIRFVVVEDVGSRRSLRLVKMQFKAGSNNNSNDLRCCSQVVTRRCSRVALWVWGYARRKRDRRESQGVLSLSLSISRCYKNFISTKARSSSQMSSREETESDIVFQRARSKGTSIADYLKWGRAGVQGGKKGATSEEEDKNKGCRRDGCRSETSKEPPNQESDKEKVSVKV